MAIKIKNFTGKDNINENMFICGILKGDDDGGQTANPSTYACWIYRLRNEANSRHMECPLFKLLRYNIYHKNKHVPAENGKDK